MLEEPDVARMCNEHLEQERDGELAGAAHTRVTLEFLAP